VRRMVGCPRLVAPPYIRFDYRASGRHAMLPTSSARASAHGVWPHRIAAGSRIAGGYRLDRRFERHRTAVVEAEVPTRAPVSAATREFRPKSLEDLSAYNARILAIKAECWQELRPQARGERSVVQRGLGAPRREPDPQSDLGERKLDLDRPSVCA